MSSIVSSDRLHVRRLLICCFKPAAFLSAAGVSVIPFYAANAPEYLIQKTNEDAGQARVCPPSLPCHTRPPPHWSAPGEGMRGAVWAGPGGRWGAEDSCAVRTLAWSGGRGKAGLEDLCGRVWLNPASYSGKLRPHRSAPTPCPCGPRMSL